MTKKITLIVISFFIVGVGYLIISKKNINDAALSFFQGIKTIKGQDVDLSNVKNLALETVQHGIWDDLLRKHVPIKGKVNYQGFINDQAIFEEYLDLLSNRPPSQNWTKNEQLAYWINTYNAFTVKLIIDHYPLTSIKDIAGNIPMINSPWDIKFFKIGGVDFDLNTIEHEILRKQFNEPRIHFAINCASNSCPDLRAEAYTSDRLVDQLEDQASGFINDTDKNVVTTDRLILSKIFDWFKSDFTKENTLLNYINQYSKVDIGRDHTITYMDYDWNLNDVNTHRVSSE